MAVSDPFQRLARSSMLGGLLLFGCATAPQAPAKPARAPTYGQAAKHVKHVQKASTTITLSQIERHLAAKTKNLKNPRPGVWHLSIDGVMLLMIAEPERVRILAPIFSLEQLERAPQVRSALMVRLLQANFDDTIDARYAIFDGIVFAAVTHTRENLVPADIDRFLLQIVNLHKNTFRTGQSAYSSNPPEPGSLEIDPRLDESLKPLEEPEKHLDPENLPNAEYDTLVM